MTAGREHMDDDRPTIIKTCASGVSKDRGAMLWPAEYVEDR